MNEIKEINLILQGGGVKGLAYIGALRCLEEHGFKVKYVSGSSIGAIIGSLIIAGYDSYELEKIVNNIPYDIFLEKNNLSDQIKKGGVYSLSKAEKYLEKLLVNKNIRIFEDIKVGNNYKAIFISTSLKYQRIFVLPHDLKIININPDKFPIAKAVIMSASIPFFYERYKVNNDYFYDGGMSDNYPTWCFNNGIALKLGEESNLIKSVKNKIFGKIQNNNFIEEVFINTSGYKATDFKKGFFNKYDLYKRGYHAMESFINSRLIL